MVSVCPDTAIGSTIKTESFMMWRLTCTIQHVNQVLPLPYSQFEGYRTQILFLWAAQDATSLLHLHCVLVHSVYASLLTANTAGIRHVWNYWKPLQFHFVSISVHVTVCYTTENIRVHILFFSHTTSLRNTSELFPKPAKYGCWSRAVIWGWTQAVTH
jgi:hypothetical protein